MDPLWRFTNSCIINLLNCAWCIQPYIKTLSVIPVRNNSRFRVRLKFRELTNEVLTRNQNLCIFMILFWFIVPLWSVRCMYNSHKNSVEYYTQQLFYLFHCLALLINSLSLPQAALYPSTIEVLCDNRHYASILTLYSRKNTTKTHKFKE